MIPIPQPRLRLRSAPLLPLLLIPALLLAACSGDDPPADDQPAEPAPTQSDAPAGAPTPADSPRVILPVPLQNDPALEARINPNDLQIPGRFVRINRDDREPILTLGLVDTAARITYAVAASAEILSFDLLRLDPTIDPEEFFLAFAQTVADIPAFRGVDTIGVPRGIGDRARHIAFNVDGDDGDAVILLRDDILAFLTYRRPPNLRQPIDIGALMRALDTALQNPASG